LHFRCAALARTCAFGAAVAGVESKGDSEREECRHGNSE
jgi:hypothetical protein